MICKYPTLASLTDMCGEWGVCDDASWFTSFIMNDTLVCHMHIMSHAQTVTYCAHMFRHRGLPSGWTYSAIFFKCDVFRHTCRSTTHSNQCAYCFIIHAYNSVINFSYGRSQSVRCVSWSWCNNSVLNISRNFFRHSCNLIQWCLTVTIARETPVYLAREVDLTHFWPILYHNESLRESFDSLWNAYLNNRQKK